MCLKSRHLIMHCFVVEAKLSLSFDVMGWSYIGVAVFTVVSGG